MRIISDWKDYYDTASIFGIDKTKIYLRKTLYLDVPLVRKQNSLVNITTKFDIIGFCGEIFIFNNYSKKIDKEWLYNPKKSILWEEDALKYKYIEIEPIH
jgi:hypothetical protein